MAFFDLPTDPGGRRKKAKKRVAKKKAKKKTARKKPPSVKKKKVKKKARKATRKKPARAKTTWGEDLVLCRKCKRYKLKGKKCEACPAAKPKKAPRKKTPRAKKKKKAARTAGPARRYPKRQGSWALTHVPSGLAIVVGVSKKSDLKKLASSLTRIQKVDWSDSEALIKAALAKKPPKWWLSLSQKVHRLVNKYTPKRRGFSGQSLRIPPPLPPSWHRGAGKKRWVKEDVVVSSSPYQLFVIEGEVLYPNRYWAITRTLSEASETPVNPGSRQPTMVGRKSR